MRTVNSSVKRAVAACRFEALEDRRLLSATLVRDMNPAGSGLSPNSAGGSVTRLSAPVGDAVVFGGTDNTTGTELWRTDGTGAGTYRVKDLNLTASGTATASSFPSGFFAAGDVVYFSAATAEHGRELWVTDGTAAGTRVVTDLNAGVNSSSPRALGVVDGRLLFFAGGSAGTGLYRTNAANDGAELVRAFTDTTAGRTGANTAVFGNKLYFAAGDAANGSELWASDGTADGTKRLTDIGEAGKGSSPDLLTVFNDRLYFTAADNDTGGVGTELWSTDGTTTSLVADINPGAASASPSVLTVVGSKLYFGATSAAGAELWALDAAAATPVQVADLSPGSTGTGLSSLTDFNGELVFTASTPSTGPELFKVDAAGNAAAISEISVGFGSGILPVILGQIDGQLLFRVSDSFTGSELYQTDGTRSGTFLTDDIAAGAASSQPFALGVIGGRLLLGATEPTTGTELWSAVPDPIPTGPVLDSGTLRITGDDAVDYVRVLRDAANGQIVVQQHGATYRYGGVTHVTAALAGGDDVLDLAGDLGVPLSVNGGGGNNAATLRFTDAADAVNLVERYVSRGGAPVLDYFDLQSLTVLTAGGDDSITIGANVGAALYVDSGTGADAFNARQATRGSTLLGGTGADSFLTDNDVIDSVDGGGFTTSEIDTATADANDTVSRVESVTRAGTGVISGVVYNDVNGNGQRDSGETGLGGWTISLTRGSDGRSRSAVTTADGAYAFGNLNDGSYDIVPVAQSGWQQAAASGSNVITSGNNTMAGINFGPTQAALIGGYAVNDVNGNGLPDTGETALAGATFYWDRNNNSLFDASETGDVTDSTGRYQFGITVGQRATIRTLPPAGHRSLRTDITLDFNTTSFQRQDFAFTARPLVTGRVFIDRDRDGTRDPAETSGQGGATVWADLDADGVRDSVEPAATTSSAGNYSIANLPAGAGTYTFYVTAPSGVAPTAGGSFTKALASGEISTNNDLGVANTAAPRLTNLPADQAADEAAAATLQIGAFSDFAHDGPWQVTVDYGDGTSERFTQSAAGDLAARSHTYAESGAYTLSVSVTDAYGAVGSATSLVSVANVAPTAALTPATTAPVEGAAVQFVGGATDPSAGDTAAGFAYGWTVTRDGVTIATGEGADVVFVPADNGDYVVTLTATDRDNGVSAPATATVTVANTAPAASITGLPAGAVEGQTITADALVTDAPADTAAGFTYAWTVTRDGVAYASGGTDRFDFIPDDQGQYVLTLVVTDKDGAASTTATAALSVSNAAPAATFANAGPFAEGTIGRATFTNIIDASADTHTFAYDLNNDGDFTDSGDIAATTNPFVNLSLPDQGSRTVRGRVIDKDGAFRDYVTTLQFANASPTTVIKSPNTAQRNKDYTLVFATQDAPTDLAAGFRYQVNFGDGTRPVTLTGGQNGADVLTKYRYRKAGQYTITVTTTDKDGATSIATLLLRVA